MIRQLKKYVRKGDRILDVGTGSGILSVISLLLGAGSAVGTDLDPGAIPAVSDNLTKNSLLSFDPEEAASDGSPAEYISGDGRFRLLIGNIIDDERTLEKVRDFSYQYDIITANILPYVLIPLAPLIPGLLTKDGVYIASGIIEPRKEDVSRALEAAGLIITEVTSENEWVSLTARRR